MVSDVADIYSMNPGPIAWWSCDTFNEYTHYPHSNFKSQIALRETRPAFQRLNTAKVELVDRERAGAAVGGDTAKEHSETLVHRKDSSNAILRLSVDNRSQKQGEPL